MSVPAEVIQRPQDLGLPPETVEVFHHLTEEGATVFSREIVKAIMHAQAKGNFRPVRDVVETWYRTLRMVSHPEYDAAVEWTLDPDRPREAYPGEEIVERHSKS